MKFYTTLGIFASVCITVHSSLQISSFSPNTKVADAHSANQTKRDLSLSYAATNIDSKEGTRVKTITVIKSVGGGGKQTPLAINPEFYKNEDWGSAFRDHFESYGKIPDVPDIDDLIEFMKKPTNKNKTTETRPFKDNIKPTLENSANMSSADEKDHVDKIQDVKLLPSSGNKLAVQQPIEKRLQISNEEYRMHEPAIDVNYSMTNNSLNKQLNEHVQSNSSAQKYVPRAITLNMPGQALNILDTNNSNKRRPYIAPAVANKTKFQENEQSVYSPVNQKLYMMNSLLPLVADQGRSNVYSFLSESMKPQTKSTSTSHTFFPQNVLNDLHKRRRPSIDHIKIHSDVSVLDSRNKRNNLRSRGLNY